LFNTIKIKFMKQIIIFLLIVMGCLPVQAQNIGINTLSPTEALDVHGNLNLTGTIKANGIDGIPGQVLARGAGSQLLWQTLSGSTDIRQVFTVTTPGAVQTFTVPAGINKITIELWGGGGAGGAVSGFTGILAIYGGGAAGGGGGGGYLKADVTVTPGQIINIVIGRGATASNAAEPSTVTAGTLVLTAQPGSNAQILSTGGGLPTNYFISGTGGSFSISDASFRNYSFQKGADGELPVYRAYAIQTGTFVDDYLWGKGGTAGNSPQTNGNGGQSVGLGLSYHYAQGTAGGTPGGGGGGDRNRINPGGNGLVVISY
jgi:hypothetical protein